MNKDNWTKDIIPKLKKHLDHRSFLLSRLSAMLSDQSYAQGVEEPFIYWAFDKGIEHIEVSWWDEYGVSVIITYDWYIVDKDDGNPKRGFHHPPTFADLFQVDLKNE